MKVAFLFRSLLMGFALLSSSACKKTAPEIEGLSYVNGLPYYHFTKSDRQWFQAKTGDVWTFENGQGAQRRYRVYFRQYLQVENKIRVSGFISDTYKLVGYLDEAEISLANVDTASSDSGGRFQFYTDPAVATNDQPVSGLSWLRASATWVTFGGTNRAIIDYYHPVGNQLKGPYYPITTPGSAYAEVVLFSTYPRGQYAPPASPTSLDALYYDHQAGLVRMVSLAGEVWDRVL